MTNPLRLRTKDTVMEDCRKRFDVKNKLTIQILVSPVRRMLIRRPSTSYLHAYSGGDIYNIVFVTYLCSCGPLDGVVSGGALMGVWKTS